MRGAMSQWMFEKTGLKKVCREGCEIEDGLL
jgi:hypothetical protein